MVAFEVRFSTLATMVLAESAVGVEVGDWIKYDFTAALASDDPNMELTPFLIAMNNTEWVKNVVVTISDTKITFERVIHYKDGNETKSVEYVDVDTGESSLNGSLIFIPSNLQKNDLVHASLTSHHSINETIRRTYMEATRDINHLEGSGTTYEGSDVTVATVSYDWDKATGILCERLITLVTYGEVYTMAFQTFEKIVDTNIAWTHTEAPPSPITSISILVVLALILTGLFVWRLKKRRRKR
ncbi:MAG: hypothetical protein JSV15_03725 [Candidatus Bathyarchaeota archaeon]|nr:MAG: hypothetical protein JSV15_03725 [Candidatus Bathyarchaeota archaeon]